MAKYEVFVGKLLDDGRLVVTSNSRIEIPRGTTFSSAFWTNVDIVDGEFRNRQCEFIGDISLTLESVEVFRREIESIPNGYSAAVGLTGSGLELVLHWVGSKQNDVQIFLRAD